MSDIQPLSDKIYEWMNEIKGETEQGYLDSRFDELMDWISDNFYLTYYGSEFTTKDEEQ